MFFKNLLIAVPLAIFNFACGAWWMYNRSNTKLKALEVQTEAALKESKTKNIKAEQAIKSMLETRHKLIWEMHKNGWLQGRIRGMVTIMTHQYDEPAETGYSEDSTITSATLQNDPKYEQ